MSAVRAQPLGRLSLGQALEAIAMAMVPVLALAYPMLIQPLMNYQPASAYASLSDLANVTAADSNIANQIFWLALFGFAAWLFRKRLDALRDIFRTRTIAFLALYLALAGLSVLWSPVPGIAFRRLVLQVVVVMTMVLPIYLSLQRERVINGFVLLASVVIVINLAFVATHPPGRLGYLGIYSNKNILGLVASICFLLTIYASIARKGLGRIAYGGLALLALALTVVSQSKTSLGFVLIAPVASWALIWGQRTLKIHMAGLILLLLFVATTIVGLVFQVTGTGFRDVSLLLLGDDTFTGRTQIWDFVLGVYARAPYVGTGYASFWGTGTSSVAFLEAPGFIAGLLQAHNGYLDLMLETGALGLALLVCILLTSFNQINRGLPPATLVRWLAFSLMLFVISHNLLESSWFRGFGSQWLVFLAAIGLTLSPPPIRRPRPRSARQGATPRPLRHGEAALQAAPAHRRFGPGWGPAAADARRAPVD